ncbi:hypothetical protein AD949_02040 [Acetobacter orleanensis]|nr:hypothetical protein AD949_02040 [Acetobacter orleanensis]PCD78438.1 hypothetical protein CO710_12140 [Acetobacter orleanensis]
MMKSIPQTINKYEKSVLYIKKINIEKSNKPHGTKVASPVCSCMTEHTNKFFIQAFTKQTISPEGDGFQKEQGGQRGKHSPLPAA